MKICVFDDDEIFCHYLCKKLHQFGHETLCFPVYHDTLIEEDSGIDVFIVDMKLGTQDGLEIVENILKKQSPSRFIISSGKILESQKEKLSLLGIENTLLKPYTSEELQKTIQKVCKRY